MERVGKILRHDLRQDRIAHHFQLAGSGGSQRFLRSVASEICGGKHLAKNSGKTTSDLRVGFDAQGGCDSIAGERDSAIDLGQVDFEKRAITMGRAKPTTTRKTAWASLQVDCRLHDLRQTAATKWRRREFPKTLCLP